MSNKTQLQTNNTTLDGYITRINAAKDVAASLPEAGSGVPATGNFTITNAGMEEPVVYKYDFYNDELQLSKRTCMIVWFDSDSQKQLILTMCRASISDPFDWIGSFTNWLHMKNDDDIVDDSTISLYGEISDTEITRFGFYAW